MLKDCPKISVVSPSLNCVHLIEKCIHSVSTQNYPNIEHIIVDGASTDGTIEVLKKYNQRIKWISEKDSGEAEALNKALRMTTGDIITWLNVDDQYLGTDVFELVVNIFKNSSCDKVYGKGLAVNEEGEILWYRRSFSNFNLATIMRWFANPNLYQPSMFYSRKVIAEVGEFREDLKYGIDYEYWLRTAAKKYNVVFVDQVLSYATLVRKGAKSQGPWEDQHLVWQEIVRPFQDFLSLTDRINYWKDFYYYRIKSPVPYTSPFPLPRREEEALGMVYAALEHVHLEMAALGIEFLSNNDSNNLEDVYWLLSEALNKMGNHQESIKTAKQAQQIALNKNKINNFTISDRR